MERNTNAEIRTAEKSPDELAEEAAALDAATKRDEAVRAVLRSVADGSVKLAKNGDIEGLEGVNNRPDFVGDVERAVRVLVSQQSKVNAASVADRLRADGLAASADQFLSFVA